MTHQTAQGAGYARLTRHGIDVLAAPAESGILFVDIALGVADNHAVFRSAWRTMPPSALDMCSRIALRSPIVRYDGELEGIDRDDRDRVLARPAGDWPIGPDALAEHVATLFDEYHLPQRDVHAFELPVNGDARKSRGSTPELLAACRAVELEALLRSRNAIWEPNTYHYELPSGDHANSFVRIAEAFTDGRAPAALASWLRGALKDSTVLVVDTGTLVPLIDQLDLLIERAAAKLPLPYTGLMRVLALDDYPRSRFQYLRRFKDVSTTSVLAVLSVSSSGRTYRLLGETLRETVPDWRAECLVSRDARDAAEALPAVAERERQDPWLALPTDDIRDRSECRLCGRDERARVVRIDPRTFGAMVLPAPVHEMPDIMAAGRNASLFEDYDVAIDDVPPIQLAPTESSRLRAKPRLRAFQPSRVRFEPLGLLMRDDVARRVTERVVELERLPGNDPARTPTGAALEKLRQGDPNVVVCDDEEIGVLAHALELEDNSLGEDAARAAAERRFLDAAAAVCPSAERVVAIKRDASAAGELGDDDRLLLFVAGLQSGVTLQHLVVDVRDAVASGPEIYGLVLHAHPDSSGAWYSVRNTFGGKRNSSLLALWLTYLPPESPFVAEFDVLESAQDEWFEGAQFGARERYDERMEWLRPGQPETAEAPRPVSPLWSPVQMKLRPTSRYGALDDRQCVAAMGAAVGETLDRYDSDSAPEWVRLDLPNALRSYFDGVLHASLLRWVSPPRVWWGTANECRSIIDELYGRFPDGPDWTLLLAELLLACAQGKLPDDGANAVIDYARAALKHPPEGQDLGFVELGYILASRRLGEPADEDPDDDASEAEGESDGGPGGGGPDGGGNGPDGGNVRLTGGNEPVVELSAP